MVKMHILWCCDIEETVKWSAAGTFNLCTQPVPKRFCIKLPYRSSFGEVSFLHFACHPGRKSSKFSG